jgi:hypothetical protein
LSIFKTQQLTTESFITALDSLLLGDEDSVGDNSLSGMTSSKVASCLDNYAGIENYSDISNKAY